MRARGLAALGLLALAACADLFGPRAYRVSLTIVPVFDAADPYAAAASTVDSLRIIVVRDSSGVFRDTVAKVVAPIDSAGEVNTTINVTLLQSPQQFKIILQAVRSADGMVVFSGEQVVSVTAESSSGQGQQIATIPISYTGPRARAIRIAPRDTALVSGAIAYRVTAYDSVGNVVTGVEARYFLVNPGDSTRLTIDRLTGIATTGRDSGQVRVYARTVDSLAYDTARVFVGAGPVGLKITPGFLGLRAGDTATLSATLLNALGSPLPGGTVTWESRTTSVATVSGAGLVTGVGAGTAVVVASASGFSDSVLVRAVPTGNVILWALPGGRSFQAVRVGDTSGVELTADFRAAPTEKLGSYQASLDWSASVLQYLDVQSTSFAAPTVNPGTGTCTHQLCLAAADPQNAASQVAVARVRLRALAAGTVTPTLAVTEMSSNVPPTFTNLFAGNRVAVTAGTVTVRP